jgi:hypothetical protein
VSTQPSDGISAFRYRVFPASAIIVIGVLFLLHNLGVHLSFLHNDNWWAWLILVVALAPLSRAWEIYRTTGDVNTGVLHHVISTAGVVMIAVMFLLKLDWSKWWPLFVILGGVYTMIGHNRYRQDWSREEEQDPALRL